MIFPVGDDQVKGGAWPIFSYSFIVLNVLIYFFIQVPNEWFTYAYGAVPYEITNQIDLIESVGEIPHFPGPTPIYLTLITSVFMHGGFMHLLGNMVFLWIFADNIESTIGNLRFIWFYLIGGIIASLTHIYSAPESVIPLIGASGAIAACLGAYLVMFPRSTIKVLFFIKIFRVPGFVFLGIWIAQQFISVYAEGANATSGGVAWYAHIGGFMFGVLLGIYFRFKYPKIRLVREGYRTVFVSAKRYNNRRLTKYFD